MKGLKGLPEFRIEPIRQRGSSSSRYIQSAYPDIGLDIEDPDIGLDIEDPDVGLDIEDPDIFCGREQLCCCVGAYLNISVKDLFCQTWVAAVRIGAQSTVVEQQLGTEEVLMYSQNIE